MAQVLFQFRPWPRTPGKRFKPSLDLLGDTQTDIVLEALRGVLTPHITAVQRVVPQPQVEAVTEQVTGMSLPSALCELGKFTTSLVSSPTLLVQMGQPILQDLVSALQEDPYKQMQAQSALRSVQLESDVLRKADLLCRTFVQLAS